MRYYKELDIIKILKKVRDAETFRKSFLNRQQQILLKFGAQNVIKSDSDSEKEKNKEDPIEDLS